MTSDCRTFGALLARLRQNCLDSAGWLLRLRGSRVPSENVVKWYGGVVQVAPASEVKYIVTAFQCSQLRQLLWQSSSPGRCGVTLADCCCGSRDVAASHSHTGVAAAETLRRHTLRLLLRQQSAPSPAMSYASRVAGVIERCKRQLLRLLPRRALWPNVALKKPNGTIIAAALAWVDRVVNGSGPGSKDFQMGESYLW